MGFILNGINAVCTFITSTIAHVGPVIGNMAKEVFRIIANLPIPEIDIVSTIKFISDFVHAIAEIMGIRSDEDPEVLGAKAEQCEKKLDDFNNDVEAYIEYLNNEVQLDKERFNSLTTEERVGCRVIGMALETKAIEKKFGGIEISPESLVLPILLREAGIVVEPDSVLQLINKIMKLGITKLSDVSDYLSGKGESDRLKTGDALYEALGENAEITINSLKDAVRKYEEK